MKASKSIIVALSCLLSIAALNAQNERDYSPTVNKAPRNVTQQKNEVRPLTNRAQEFNKRLTQRSNNAPWMRVIYRRVDLSQEANAPLYYPPQPTADRQNLFSTLFNLLNTSTIEAYEYLDGYEVYTEEYAIKFQEFLDRFGIYYQPSSNKESGRQFDVAANDIPSALVKAYFVKEQWYFDSENSNVDIKIEAICPIIIEDDEFGESRSMPLFWVPYENIRPYISQERVMLSSLNNVRKSTLDDYFRLNLYKGDIIKTENLLGRSLYDYNSNIDSVRLEGKRIEKELDSFRSSLFVTQDSTWKNQAELTKKGRKAKTTRSGRNITSRTRSPKDEEAVLSAPSSEVEKQEAPAEEKKRSKRSESATRSVRRK